MTLPLNFPTVPAELSVDVIAKLPSRYYRVPRYFFTVLTVAHHRWYRPTLGYATDLLGTQQSLFSTVQPFQFAILS